MTEKLKCFLWLLLRDHMPFGTIEAILLQVEGLQGEAPRYDDVELERYVLSLVGRLS